ncbi:MAG: hypothetical protein C4576_31815 [Desulfobacteraceae bacterium]|nr:MAG: hypothetical protein C4576_31815 [Desulfobacteraceae bacterium]
MVKRKYFTEIALGFYSGGIVLLHPRDIRTVDQQSPETTALAEECHIYLIVKRPRVSYVPGSLVIADGKMTGQFRYILNGVTRESGFHFVGEPNADRLEISKYPHTNLSLIRNEEVTFTLPSHLASVLCDHLDDELLRDFEVQYVGMSYADGHRSAKDRLQNHATLQQVLADLNLDSPDDEALLIMVQYAPPQTLIMFDGRDKSLRLEDDRDLGKDLERQEDKITEDLQIALIEASLIKYFAPFYNDKYKKRFPNPTQKILNEVYSIDFGALTTEINTEEINSRLFSSTQKPGFHHIANFDLHDPSVRRSFFNLMNVDSGPNASDLSGPYY